MLNRDYQHAAQALGMTDGVVWPVHPEPLLLSGVSDRRMPYQAGRQIIFGYAFLCSDEPARAAWASVTGM